MDHNDLFPSRLGLAACTLCSVAVALGVGSCGGGSDTAVAWDGAVRDSVGIEIVENFGAPMWRAGERWTFTEVLRIGAAEGAPEYQFGQITGFAVLSDRRIVVMDAMTHNLRFYSPDGVYERTVGREGQGPGEFGPGIWYPRVGPGDTLLVNDGQGQPAQVFAPDGTWVGSFSLLPAGGYRFDGLSRDDPVSGRVLTVHVPLRQSDGTLTDTVDIVLERDSHGAVVDTLARIPTYQTHLASGGSLPFYIELPDIALCDGGLVIGYNYRYRFVWYGPGEAARRLVSLARERLPLTEEVRSVILGRYDQLLQENGVPAERAAVIKSNVHFTETYPQYSHFVCGPAGTLLVQRVLPFGQMTEQERRTILVTTRRPPGALEWDVFDRDGRYFGPVELPGTRWVDVIPFPRFAQDRTTGSWYMYSLWADEDGVQYVVGWRMEGPMLR